MKKPKKSRFTNANIDSKNATGYNNNSYPSYERQYNTPQDHEDESSMRQDKPPEYPESENPIKQDKEKDDICSENYSISHDGNSRKGDYFSRSKVHKSGNKGKMDNVRSVSFTRKHVTVVMENKTEILEKYTSLRNQLARG